MHEMQTWGIQVTQNSLNRYILSCLFMESTDCKGVGGRKKQKLTEKVKQKESWRAHKEIGEIQRKWKPNLEVYCFGWLILCSTSTYQVSV